LFCLEIESTFVKSRIFEKLKISKKKLIILYCWRIWIRKLLVRVFVDYMLHGYLCEVDLKPVRLNAVFGEFYIHSAVGKEMS